MGYEDKQDEQAVLQLYDLMRRADNSSPKMNLLETDVIDRHLARGMRFRALAGSVVLELIRLKATSGVSPTLGQAERLVVFNQGLKEGQKAQVSSLAREVRRGFSQYKSTVHLQAAMVFARPSITSIEASEADTLEFLARARAFEEFLDAHLVGRNIKWEPWRVPDKVAPRSEITVPRLSAEERAVAGLANG
jgi:hypothetical protein